LSDKSNKYVVGVDLGGTKIYTVLADLNGRVIAEMKVPTSPEEGQEKVIGRIVNTITMVCQEAGIKEKAKAVGVGAPALVDHRQGVVFLAPNLGWHEVPLKKILENRLKVPVKIDNDVNLAALGEYIYGLEKGINESSLRSLATITELVYIAVGTGIGGGLILDGQIYHGANGSAGEIGHMTIEPEGPLCSCGNRGCLEALASGSAIAREARELLKKGRGNGLLLAAGGRQADITAQTVAKAARAGDPEAQVIDRKSVV